MKNGRIHYTQSPFGGVIPVPEFIDKEIKFNQTKFLNLFRNIVFEQGYCYKELAQALNCSASTIGAYMRCEETVTVKPELIRFVMWFVGPAAVDACFDIDKE